MRKLLQRLLSNWIICLTNKYGSSPDGKRINSALTILYQEILKNPGKRGLVIPVLSNHRFIILSDQHKGARDFADDFTLAEKNYLAALDYYHQESFHYINLGDSEELWENLMESVIRHNSANFEKEKQFIGRNAFTKIFGNHDLYWDNDPLSGFNLKRIYGEKIPIYEGLILQFDLDGTQLEVFLTHGHQGDLQSDGNWFSKWFVSTIWAPFQSFLKINPNTPAYDNQLKTKHNALMYEWASNQPNLALITGHTHQPVFASLTHLERIYLRLQHAKNSRNKEDITVLTEEINKRIGKGDKAPDFPKYRASYFNSGCCCFNDGDITGIEIVDGNIRLIKWSYQKTENPERFLLEEMNLKSLLDRADLL